MRVGEGQLDGYAALRRTDIDHGAHGLPREIPGEGLRHWQRKPGHGMKKAFQPGRISIERIEQIPAMLRLVLRLTGAQSLRERAPEAVKACIEHFDDTANAAGSGGVEEKIAFVAVAVASG